MIEQPKVSSGKKEAEVVQMKNDTNEKDLVYNVEEDEMEAEQKEEEIEEKEEEEEEEEKNAILHGLGSKNMNLKEEVVPVLNSGAEKNDDHIGKEKSLWLKNVPVMDEMFNNPEITTPTISIQHVEWESKRTTCTSSATRMTESVVKEPETPIESKGCKGLNVDGKELMGVVKKKSSPKILSDIIICLVDYPELVDSNTMKKWKEVLVNVKCSTLDQCVHVHLI